MAQRAGHGGAQSRIALGVRTRSPTAIWVTRRLGSGKRLRDGSTVSAAVRRGVPGAPPPRRRFRGLGTGGQSVEPLPVLVTATVDNTTVACMQPAHRLGAIGAPVAGNRRGGCRQDESRLRAIGTALGGNRRGGSGQEARGVQGTVGRAPYNTHTRGGKTTAACRQPVGAFPAIDEALGGNRRGDCLQAQAFLGAGARRVPPRTRRLHAVGVDLGRNRRASCL